MDKQYYLLLVSYENSSDACISVDDMKSDHKFIRHLAILFSCRLSSIVKCLF